MLPAGRGAAPTRPREAHSRLLWLDCPPVRLTKANPRGLDGLWALRGPCAPVVCFRSPTDQ